MSDVRTQLERLAEHVRSNADAFERLERRRRRRVRNRRVGGIVVAVAIALGGSTGAILALREHGRTPVAGSGVVREFAPIWPDSTAADAKAADDAFASATSSLPAWRTDPALTGVTFASTALGWSDARAGDASTTDLGGRVTVSTPAVPCPTPTTDAVAWCGGRSVIVDLQRLSPAGPWWVVGVHGNLIAGVSFEVGPSGDAATFSVDTADGGLAPGSALLYVAVTGVGSCRGWESDTMHADMALENESLPEPPADAAEGCDAIVVALGLAADSPSPRGLGQRVLFGSGVNVDIHDAAAQAVHLAPSSAATAPAQDTLQIRCDGDISIPSDAVVAAEDGVSLRVVNGFVDTPVTFELAPAHDGNVPTATLGLPPQGSDEWVWSIAPGRYLATCRYPDTPGGKAHHATVSFEVTDPDHVFVSPRLDCSEPYVGGAAPLAPSERNGDPAELTRSHLDGLTDADTIERTGGYPQNAPTIVSIVRDGRTVGSVSFFEDHSGGVQPDTITGCEGTDFTWPGSPRGSPTGATGASGTTGTSTYP